MSRLKIAIVLGTRPEIIKMSPIIRGCEKRKDIDFFILHSGQHYDYGMDKIFFEELGLPKPKYNLRIGSKPFAQHVALMMKGMKSVFLKEQPDAVIVQGDTITVLMGALAAKKWDIPVAHHEAGLRSNDLTMPEEINRILTDHVSEFLFCPTKDALKNIKSEGLNADYHSLTGNTIVDAVQQNMRIADKSNEKSDVMKKLGVKNKGYILITAHRAENTDNPLRLKNILEGLKRVSKEHEGLKLLFMMHPRTKKRISQFGLKVDPSIKVFSPVGYLEFLTLEKNAALCITDSGGLQEECSILHVPVVTVRENTERPETITNGMNVLAGTNPERISACVNDMLCRDIKWKPIFGDGHAAERIIDELVSQLKKRKSMGNRFIWAKRLLKRNLR